uniref:Uncharacterized protein n=1 Tax=Arundo donax TaxID=35708 RepID=A0A0A8YGD0_ARUDO
MDFSPRRSQFETRNQQFTKPQTYIEPIRQGIIPSYTL